MRTFILFTLIMLILAACGGNEAAPTSPPNNDAVGTAVAATVAAQAQPTSAATAPTRTPDNAVATVDASATNTSFATAKVLDGTMTGSVKESRFYYKLDVPVGGVVTSTLSVDSSSPRATTFTLFDGKQSTIKSVTVEPGKKDQLGYRFGAPNGGVVYWEVSGESTFSLSGAASKQNDGGTGGDTEEDGSKAPVVKFGTIQGELGDDDNIDTFAMQVPTKGGRLNLTFGGTDGTYISMFDENRNYVFNGSIANNAAYQETKLIPVDRGGRWLVEVRGDGKYTVKLDYVNQDDAGSGSDAAEDYDKASQIKLGETKAEVGDEDKSDMFAIDLPKDGGIFTVTLSTKEGELNLNTFNTDRNYIDDSSANSNAPTTIARVLKLDQGGRWFVRVNGTGKYTLKTEYVGQNDANSKKDAPAEPDQAIAVESGTFEGLLGNDDRDDAFRIKADLGRKLKVFVLTQNGVANVQLFDANRNYGQSGPANDTTPYEVTVEGDGDYYVRVNGDEIRYRVEVTP